MSASLIVLLLLWAVSSTVVHGYDNDYTYTPTLAPTFTPTVAPTLFVETRRPTAAPTLAPTVAPTGAPSMTVTLPPNMVQTFWFTESPSTFYRNRSAVNSANNVTTVNGTTVTAQPPVLRDVTVTLSKSQFTADVLLMDMSAQSASEIIFDIKMNTVPRMIIQRTMTTGPSPSDSTFGMGFFSLVLYQESNNVNGFQLGLAGDVVLNHVSLVGRTFTGVVNASSPFDVFSYNDPITGASAVNVSACDATQLICFNILTANSTFYTAGALFYPLEANLQMQVDLNQLGVAMYNNQPVQLAVLAFTLTGSTGLQTQDLHNVVDLAVNYSISLNTKASCSPDIVMPFSNSVQSGYVNWNRTAVGIGATGTANAVNVHTQSFNCTDPTIVSANLADGVSSDAALSALVNSSKVYFIYSFTDPLNGYSRLSWDPEMGSDVVSTQNLVAFVPIPGTPRLLLILRTVVGLAFAIVIAVLLVIAAVSAVSFYLKKQYELKEDPEIDVISGPLISYDNTGHPIAYPEEEMIASGYPSLYQPPMSMSQSSSWRSPGYPSERSVPSIPSPSRQKNSANYYY
eukprot:TRINITY_DN490_c0_g1_i1.p1 TRINITY_DN490_c0_g1~~TRINITY_DN490_c0_g1_i1.p1  ORF type:complete len:570 (-),score=121.57 TRINITY_DN490_c0_g1_i1:903-2612(-)